VVMIAFLMLSPFIRMHKAIGSERAIRLDEH
jgi:hypothetical protein